MNIPARAQYPITRALSFVCVRSFRSGCFQGVRHPRWLPTPPSEPPFLRPSCRSMSSRDTGVDSGIAVPGTMDPGNTPLGKGYDILEDDPEARPKCVISGYDPWGFEVGDVDARSSVVVFPNSFVLWKPRRVEDVTFESLKLITLVKPPIDLLLVGLGETMKQRLDAKVVKEIAACNIKVEFMSTPNACATFNVLNGEDRRVAAALLTLSSDEEPSFSVE